MCVCVYVCPSSPGSYHHGAERPMWWSSGLLSSKAWAEKNWFNFTVQVWWEKADNSLLLINIRQQLCRDSEFKKKCIWEQIPFVYINKCHNLTHTSKVYSTTSVFKCFKHPIQSPWQLGKQHVWYGDCFSKEGTFQSFFIQAAWNKASPKQNPAESVWGKIIYLPLWIPSFFSSTVKSGHLLIQCNSFKSPDFPFSKARSSSWQACSVQEIIMKKSNEVCLTFGASDIVIQNNSNIIQH